MKNTIRTLPLLILPIFAVLLVIWYPFGFRLIGLIEEWEVLGVFTTHGALFVLGADSPMPAHSLRPLTAFPHALAYLLDPNSFNYWNILLILSLAIKACTTSHLMWKATHSLVWGIIIGLLVLVYPADTMQLSFRSLHINLALSLLLLASSFFIIGFDSKKKLASYGFCILSAMLLFIAVCMYEIALSLVLFPFMILFIRSGFTQCTKAIRRNKHFVFAWIAGAGAYILYALYTAHKVQSYQSSAIEGHNPLNIIMTSFPKLFSVGLLRGLLSGWYDALRMVWFEYVNYYYLLASVLAVGLVFFLACMAIQTKYNHDQFNATPKKSVTFRLLFSGFLLTLCGYLPFLLLPHHQIISQRTFLWVAPGAAMFWGAILIFLANRTKILAGLLSFSLIFIGIGAQIFQMHHYVQIGESQRILLKAIVENFDGNLNGKTLIILDGTNQLGHTWMFPPSALRVLPNALTYIYGQAIGPVMTCHSDVMEWQEGRDNLGRKGKCVVHKNGWLFVDPSPLEKSDQIPSAVANAHFIPNSEAIVLKINTDGSVVADPSLNAYRQKLLEGNGELSKRYLGILRDKPDKILPSMFVNPDLKDNYRWSFGNWWSMELPIRGSGWGEAEWQVQKSTQYAVAWKTQDEATLHFSFTPKTGDYIFRAKFPIFINEDIKHSLRIHLNGTEIVYHWLSPDIIEGKVSPGLLRTGLNDLAIFSISDKTYYGLSLRLAWFELLRNINKS